MTIPQPHVHDVVVLGAGHAGLGLAVTLAAAGVDDVVVLDPARDLTSVARHAATTAPALLHDYRALAPHDWRHLHPTIAELADYLRRLTEVLPRPVHHHADVVDLARQGDTGTWTVTRADGGQHAARLVVIDTTRWPRSAPPPRGLDQFGGVVVDADLVEPEDVAGKVVGLVATPGQTAAMVPWLLDAAVRVKVFQRDPAWVLPRPNPHLPAMARLLLRAVPPARDATTRLLAAGTAGAAHLLAPTRPSAPVRHLLARHHLHRATPDPWVREQLQPSRRGPAPTTVASRAYYAAVQAPTCDLVSWPVADISADGVRTADGIEHHVDVLVVAGVARPPTLTVSGEVLPSIGHARDPAGGLALPALHLLQPPPPGRAPAAWVEDRAARVLRQLDDPADVAPRVQVTA